MHCICNYLKCTRRLPQQPTHLMRFLLRMKSRNCKQSTPICLQLLLTSWKVPNIRGKEDTTMNNNLNFQFGMYESAINSIIVNADYNSVLIICCKECNSSVIFDDPNDVAYLYQWQRKRLFCMPN